MRFGLVKGPKFSVLLHLDPGLKVYRYGYDDPFFYNYGRCGRFWGYCNYGRALVGLTIPFGAEFGLHFNPKWTLQFGADLNVDVFFARYGGVGVINPMGGAGFEFKPTDRMALGVNTRFGPTWFAGDYNYCFGPGCGGYAGWNVLAQFFIGGRL